jgi:hypothetical protein
MSEGSIRIGGTTYQWDETSKCLVVTSSVGQELLDPDQAHQLYIYLYDHQDAIREAVYALRYGEPLRPQPVEQYKPGEFTVELKG